MMMTKISKVALKLRVSSRRMEVWNIIATVVLFIFWFLWKSVHIIMKFTRTSVDLLVSAQRIADILIVVLADDGKKNLMPAAQTGVQATLAQAIKAGHCSTEKGNTLALYQAEGWAAPKVFVLGVGVSQAGYVRQAIEKCIKEQAKDSAKLAICFWPSVSEQQLHVAMQAACSAGYVYSHTKPSAKASVKQVVWGLPDTAAMRKAFDYGQAMVAGMTLAREWGNRPSNYATPTLLAETAKNIAKQGNAHNRKRAFSCEVLDRAKIEKLRMGAFLSVARGTEEPPRFITLQYRGAAANQQPVVFVGKGITFDTGGISLKPGLDMDQMKFDMCGAASVLGLFEALRVLRPAINVVGLIPSCENMPSGRATKPGDVVTSMSGQTIEVLNTDAEGRLVLCDALTYAERFKPRAVVDIATLTGNCVLALGSTRCGLFSTNDPLAHALQEAADTAHDLCWRMPMDDTYGTGLQSNFADMANIAGRTAGSISAAKFLERFAGKYPWAHLDIAGVAWNEGAAKGGTGRPVPLLLQFVANLANQAVDFDGASSKKIAASSAKKSNKPAKTK